MGGIDGGQLQTNIKIHQVSSSVIVADSRVQYLSSHNLIIHNAQPCSQHQHEAAQYDIKRGARRHHGASHQAVLAGHSNIKLSFHGPERVLTDPKALFSPNISRFLIPDVGFSNCLFLFQCLFSYFGCAQAHRIQGHEPET
jgi:hypothetical protein